MQYLGDVVDTYKNLVINFKYIDKVKHVIYEINNYVSKFLKIIVCAFLNQYFGLHSTIYHQEEDFIQRLKRRYGEGRRRLRGTSLRWKEMNNQKK